MSVAEILVMPEGSARLWEKPFGKHILNQEDTLYQNRNVNSFQGVLGMKGIKTAKIKLQKKCLPTWRRIK